MSRTLSLLEQQNLFKPPLLSPSVLREQKLIQGGEAELRLSFGLPRSLSESENLLRRGRLFSKKSRGVVVFYKEILLINLHRHNDIDIVLAVCRPEYSRG
jgi:hypothetical protein